MEDSQMSEAYNEGDWENGGGAGEVQEEDYSAWDEPVIDAT
jgi:hypothetical protein